MVGKKQRKPRLFVGSSTESLGIAYAIQDNLEDDAEVTVWQQNVFDLTASALESLVRVLSKADFGVFVFKPSDVLRLRRKKYTAVRDNVVFEMGLFIGKLGRRRTFYVVPKDSDGLRIPTDLLGIRPGHYDAKRQDKNFQAALGPFCNKLRTAMRKVRPITRPGRARRSTS
jgi:predicted nucleotide-binding protein